MAAFSWSSAPGLWAWLEAASPAMLLVAFWLGILPLFSNNKGWCRILIVTLVALIAVRYQTWRIGQLLEPGGGGWFAWAIYGIEAIAMVEAAISALLLSRTGSRSHEADEAQAAMESAGSYPTVDVFIPTYNEGIEVLEKTIVGALAIDWPTDRIKVWVLDDGRRDWLRAFCERKGANYLTRKDNSHAKAGNINAAFPRTTGEFIAVFDADFIPQRSYLRRTIGLFRDPKIGCVQTPHHFYNADPVGANLLVDGMLPDDQRLFFDVIMPSRDAWDSAFCCGSCGVLRRSAIEAIGGGIPTESVTEDILTTLAMKRAGFITRYLNEKLAFGLAAESIEAFFVQRERWGRGGIQLLFLKSGPFGPGLRLIDRLLFFPTPWLIQYLVRVVGLSLPAVCLWTGASPMPGADIFEIVSYQAAFLMAFCMMMQWIAPRHIVPLLTNAAQCFASFRIAPAMLASLVKPFGTPFRVTPKGKAAGGARFDARTFWMACIVMVCTVVGVLANIGSSGEAFPVVAFWALWNCAILGIVMVIAFEAPRRRQEERLSADEEVVVVNGDVRERATALDFSLSGARVEMAGIGGAAKGSEVDLEIAGIGRVACEVVGRHGRQVRLRFAGMSDDTRDRMIVKLFASGDHRIGLRDVPMGETMSAAWNRVFGRTWLEGSR